MTDKAREIVTHLESIAAICLADEMIIDSACRFIQSQSAQLSELEAQRDDFQALCEELVDVLHEAERIAEGSLWGRIDDVLGKARGKL